MRVYDPHHPDADGAGFRFWNKEYGRSLVTMDQVKEALRQFFTIPVVTTKVLNESEHAVDNTSKEQENDVPSPTNIGDNRSSPGSAEASNTNLNSSQHGSSVEPIIRTRAISSLLLQIRSIRRWFEENDCFQFYASSLLVVYEGDRTASDVTAVKMIDFGRVRRQVGGDKGYIAGLRNLKHLLADIVDEEEERLGKVPPR
jgi:hypothetical protein